MKDSLAIGAVMFWPIVPVYWVPAHVATEYFRRHSRLAYLLVAAIWVFIAYSIFQHRSLILAYRTEFPVVLSTAGLILLAAGTLLHIWTAALLTLPGITGIHEILEPQKSTLMVKGPFAVVRHPTYLAHTIMFLGIYLFTGVTAAGVLTAADIIVISAVVIPLEEKELLRRFGEPYRGYMGKVPRLIPRIRRTHE